MAGLMSVYFHDTLASSDLFQQIQKELQNYANDDSMMKIMQHSSVVDAAESILVQAWELLSGTINFAIGLLGSLVVLLYLFFILMDYEKISEGWLRLIPEGNRSFAGMVVQDVKNGMNAYFRGQSLIALLVGILFSIGFLIIDFPIAVGLGMFIGLLNMVPYLQLIGFVPAILLAIVKAADTGQNFWFIMLLVLIVFAVVQIIQDTFLTPKIMGHVTGLHSAIILLSLSIWGSLLGILGMIIALPLTTLSINYYQKFVIRKEKISEELAPQESAES